MAVADPIDLKAKELKLIKRLLSEHLPGVKAWAYGSRVRWNARPDSDLDLVVFADQSQKGQVSALREAFEESSLPFRVDLFVWEEVPEEFHEQIKAERFEMAWGYYRETSVDDIAVPEGTVGGPFGSNLVSKDYVEFGVPVIRGQNMSHGRWLGGDYVFVSEDKSDSLSRNQALPNDIIFTQRGTLGQVAIVPQSKFPSYVVSQSQMRLRVDETIADPLFVYYVFVGPKQQEHIRQNAIQTGVPHTNLGILRATPLSLPPLAEQKRIAGILGSLDDKIEANRRMNETLEETARALFKSWFVDFDPVHAKAAGKAPLGPPFAAAATPSSAKKKAGKKASTNAAASATLGDLAALLDGGELAPMREDIAALFPDSFEDSPLGPIPKGWEVKAIGDVVDTVGGATPSKKNSAYWDNGTIPFARPKDLSGLSSPHLIETELAVTPEGVQKISSRTLPPGTVLLSSRAPIGYLAITTAPACINQGFVALKPAQGLPSSYLYFLCHARMDDIKGRANGTTFMEVSKKAFRPMPILVPSEIVTTAFVEQAGPLFDQIEGLERESATLAETRDALLPRLLAGDS